jgi:prepilin peptidase CpaA
MARVPHEVAWLVSVVLVGAALIDGWKLRVPNWLTFPLALGGWIYAAWSGGGPGLLWSLGGTALGLALLLPLYAIGGMGAGDVKLFAGVGSWVGPSLTLGAFVTAAFAGGLIALAMIAWTGEYARHWVMLQTIVHEIVTVRDPSRLSERAVARKPNMMLLPYGIPLAVGSIGYFAWERLLF